MEKNNGIFQKKKKKILKEPCLSKDIALDLSHVISH